MMMMMLTYPNPCLFVTSHNFYQECWFPIHRIVLTIVVFGSILCLAVLPLHAHRPRWRHIHPTLLVHLQQQYLLSTFFFLLSINFQVLQQQQTNNHSSFTYLSSDVKSKVPLTVSLAIMCPSVTITANTSPDVGVPVAIALAVVIFVVGIAYGVRQVSHT
jgi:TRAP-type C4-dicarboxylate transport system permease small subunit